MILILDFGFRIEKLRTHHLLTATRNPQRPCPHRRIDRRNRCQDTERNDRSGSRPTERTGDVCRDERQHQCHGASGRRAPDSNRRQRIDHGNASPADSDTFTNAGGQKHDLSYNDSAKSFNPLRLYSKVEPLSDASEKQFSVVRTHDTVMWRPRPTELTLLTLNAKAQFTEFSGNIRACFRECERTPVAS